MNPVMTVLADHQGLATAGGHQFDPRRFRRSPRALQVLEVPDVVNLHAVLGAT